jgi:peptidyl-prolyl cis-trans isomerase A (cyclophilin A)
VSVALHRLLLAGVAAASLSGCKHRPEGLLSPNAEALAKPAPDSFRVVFETSKGTFVVRAVRSWAPHGVDRFYFLARNHYYDGVKFFRALPNFVVQFGLHGDPKVNDVWKDLNIPDDSVRLSNQKGAVTYAMGGPNTRDVQLFINLRDNRRLDAMGFAPIGRVIEGMDVVERLFTGYGEGPPGGRGPDQDKIRSEGNFYLSREFPQLDQITTTRILKD